MEVFQSKVTFEPSKTPFDIASRLDYQAPPLSQEKRLSHHAPACFVQVIVIGRIVAQDVEYLPETAAIKTLY